MFTLLFWISITKDPELSLLVSSWLVRQPPKQHVRELQLKPIQLPHLPQQRSAMSIVPAQLLSAEFSVPLQLSDRLLQQRDCMHNLQPVMQIVRSCF